MENKKQEYTKEEEENIMQANEILSGLLYGKEEEGFVIIQVNKSKGILVGLEGDMRLISAAIHTILVSKNERNAVLRDIFQSAFLLSGNNVPDLTAAMKSCNNVLQELNDTMSSALKKKGGKRK